MKEGKAKPSSQPPSPLPSWREDQLSDWDEYNEPELWSLTEAVGYEEPSDWEDSIGQELPEGEDSVGQELPKSHGNRPSVQSSWKDDSDNEHTKDSWEHRSIQSTGFKSLRWEEDEWDELGVLELSAGGDCGQRLGRFAGDGMPVPIPREAWVEHQAFELCPQVPLCASPPHPEAPAPRGHLASPALEEQVPQAGTQKPVPAPQSCPSPSAPQLQAKAPRKKHLSRVRQALWMVCSLFCCLCLLPLPEDY